MTTRPEPARAQGRGAQALRQGSRPGADARRLRRQRPRGPAQLRARQVASHGARRSRAPRAAVAGSGPRCRRSGRSSRAAAR